MDTPPKRIWLQWYDEDGNESEEITWSEDQQFENDIEYTIVTKKE